MSNMSSEQRLFNLCCARNWPRPEFLMKVVRERGTTKYSCTALVNGTAYIAVGPQKNKSEIAREEAAELLLGMILES
jgi:hypothetical protein